MFKSDPIREQMRALWMIPLFLGTVIICFVAGELIDPWLSEIPQREKSLSAGWKLVGSAIMSAGGYIILRDHLVRPLRILRREIPDPADFRRLLTRVGLSGLCWSPVMAMGLSVIIRDLGGFWSIGQIGLALLVWNFTNTRGAQSVNQIAEATLPQTA